jgi:hypothetical protein
MSLTGIPPAIVVGVVEVEDEAFFGSSFLYFVKLSGVHPNIKKVINKGTACFRINVFISLLSLIFYKYLDFLKNKMIS